jgi:hypothetical protein
MISVYTRQNLEIFNKWNGNFLTLCMQWMSEVQWDTKNISRVNIQAQVCKQSLDISTILQFADN